MPANKTFVSRLHKILDEVGFPKNTKDREKAFATLFRLSGQVSHLTLRGIFMPQRELLEQIANEFEVTHDWLLGRED